MHLSLLLSSTCCTYELKHWSRQWSQFLWGGGTPQRTSPPCLVAKMPKIAIRHITTRQIQLRHSISPLHICEHPCSGDWGIPKSACLHFATAWRMSVHCLITESMADSPHKVPEMWKAFPCHDTIMHIVDLVALYYGKPCLFSTHHNAICMLNVISELHTMIRFGTSGTFCVIA